MSLALAATSLTSSAQGGAVLVTLVAVGTGTVTFWGRLQPWQRVLAGAASLGLVSLLARSVLLAS